MKITKRKNSPVRVTTTPMTVVLDEFHQFASIPARRHFGSDRPPALIATQAVVLRNSGKRVHFIGSIKWANGDPIKPEKKKFLPAQVLRRLAASV
jgi:hypothetical protein